MAALLPGFGTWSTVWCVQGCAARSRPCCFCRTAPRSIPALRFEQCDQRFGGGRDIRPGLFKAGVLAEIGIHHCLALAAGYDVQQQGNLGQSIIRCFSERCRKIRMIECEDMCEALEIRLAE